MFCVADGVVDWKDELARMDGGPRNRVMPEHGQWAGGSI
jgi:hypothetical protein